MSLFSKISLYIYHVDYHYLEHQREIRLNLKQMKFNLYWRKTRAKEKENKKHDLIFFTIFITIIRRWSRRDIFFFSFFSSDISFRLRLRFEVVVFLIVLIFLARRIVEFLSFFFLFVFSFVAIVFSASALIFVTSTKFEISSLSNRRSFAFFSFISSTKRNQSRCVH